jgi:hypothetical protein
MILGISSELSTNISTHNTLVMSVESLLTVSADELCMRRAPDRNTGRKGRPIACQLRNAHRINWFAGDFMKIKAVQQTRNRDPHIRLTNLPASAHSTSCVPSS